MPVQVPDSIRDDAGLIRYLGVAARARAGYVPYVLNVSVGMLGWLTAKAMHKDFAVLMEQRLFPRSA